MRDLKSKWLSLNRTEKYLVFQSVMTGAFLAANLLFSGKFFNSMMMGTRYQLNDYLSHLGYASSPIGTNIYAYSRDVVFPPFAYLFYGFLARLSGYTAANPADIFSHMTEGQNLTVFTLYMMISAVLLLYVISLYIQKSGARYQVLLPVLLLFSYPFLFSSIQRGNAVMLVAILLALSCIWKEDPSPIKREMALILIAVCAGFKIYPAIFGLPYLLEKKYSETFRLFVYGILIFFVPFLFWGGTEGIMTLIHNAADLGAENFSFSVNAIADQISELLTGEPNRLLGNVMQQLYFIASLAAIVLTKRKWVRTLLLSGIIAIYISSSWPYNAVYMLPAFLMLAGDTEPENMQNRESSLSFGLLCFVFSVPFYLRHYGGTAILYAIFLLQILNIAFVLVHSIPSRKGMRLSSAEHTKAADSV